MHEERYNALLGLKERLNSWRHHAHRNTQQLEVPSSQKQLDSWRYRACRTTPRLELQSLQEQHIAGYQNKSDHRSSERKGITRALNHTRILANTSAQAHGCQQNTLPVLLGLLLKASSSRQPHWSAKPPRLKIESYQALSSHPLTALTHHSSFRIQSVLTRTDPHEQLSSKTGNHEQLTSTLCVPISLRPTIEQITRIQHRTLYSSTRQLTSP
ncbi:hypothetical protein F511_33396 [Dorcoceras hygrometricum]|uniref:Uncharacterized protein n=1 Tax=Dorcoceras hygrometricum TaxID=472368 RepID=A0A2Z7ADF2_9LAMI|nr:hypothetical protein F511_33396 [Dorcoceras hygrometricum]